LALRSFNGFLTDKKQQNVFGELPPRGADHPHARLPGSCVGVLEILEMAGYAARDNKKTRIIYKTSSFIRHQYQNKN